MGYNTAVLILNDQMERLKDPAWGEDLYHAILSSRRTGGYVKAGQALPSQHADTAQVVVIAANSIHTIGYGDWQDSDEDLLRKLAKQRGYTLRKLKK